MIAPTPAQAGTATSQNGVVRYAAPRGEANDVTVWLNASSYLVEDLGAPVVPGAGCYAVTRHRVACDAGGISHVRVETSNLSDVVRLDVSVQTSIVGGLGADRLFGGSAADTLLGGGGADVLSGGYGWDDLIGGLGPDKLRGGPGIRDRAGYGERVAAVHVTLDGLRNDGESGENDLVDTSVEDVAGGAGADVIIGDAASNDLHGGRGDDRIDGGLGSDILFGDDGFDTLTYASRTNAIVAEWTSYCDSGEPNESDCIDETIERIVGGAGNDVLLAYSKYMGSATLDGGPGDDFLSASSYFATTRLLGRGGDDTLQSVNGLADVNGCGPGIDSVDADELDVVDTDCEELR